MPKIVCPACPVCGQPPMLAFATQAFCGNDSCEVLCWNPQKPGGGDERTVVELPR